MGHLPSPGPSWLAWRPVGEAYFERVDEHRFVPTDHVGGAWATDEQHVAPALGLLAHAVEQDRDRRRDDGLALTRLSFDILGVLGMSEVEVEVRVLRPGRTIELVEASLHQGGRAAVVLRAWLVARGDTAGLAGTDLPRLAPPDAVPAWDPTTVWPGGFIASADLRRSRSNRAGPRSGCAPRCRWCGSR